MDKQEEVSTGGYDYEFVETPPDLLICKICQFPSREPCLSECCGHTFCKSCGDHAKKATAYYSCLCPMCRSEEFTLFRNKQNERVIKSLHVYCSNKGRGCDWQGEINNINSHLKSGNGCPFEEIACSNNCGNVFQRKCLHDHLENECPRRKVNCQYCHITDEFQYIEGSHMKKCSKFPLPCPNDCGISDIPREDMVDHRIMCPLEEVGCSNDCRISIQRQHLQNHIENECPRREVNCPHCQVVGEQQFIEREHAEQCLNYPLVCPNKCEAENILRKDMEAHRKQCPLEMVQCQYHIVGCKTMIARKDLQKHSLENMEAHLSFTMSELVSTKNILAATKQQLQFVEQRFESNAQQVWGNKQQIDVNEERVDDNEQRIDDNEQRIDDNKQRIDDNEQRVDDNKQRVDYNEQRIDDNEQRLNDNENRIDNNERQLAIAKQQWTSRTDKAIARLQKKIEDVEQQSQLKLEMKSQQTMEQMQWALHLNTRASNVEDQTFPVIIKVSEFEKKMDNETDWYSATFYTSEGGYKLKLNVVPSGHDAGKSTHVSVYLYMGEGQSDGYLRWPMKKNLTVKLLNQISDAQHHFETHLISAKRIATQGNRWIWYAHKFISHTNLRYYPPAGCRYLVNDSLFFEVSEDN